MTLTHYGVTLRSLEHADLPMVLQWRNSDHIRCHMKNQELITPEEHQAWAASIEKRGDRYFIIEDEGTPVGLIWAKDIYDSQCETGFYLYDKTVQNTLLAYRVSLAFNDYVFDEMGLASIHCDILHENSRSIRFTLSLGYEKVSAHPDFDHYRLDRLRYTPYQQKIGRLLQKGSA